MKILMVSMPSIHFYRWVNQLKETEHEIYWFDVTGSRVKASSIEWITQITNWKLRSDFIGRTFIKKYFPCLYNKIKQINERDLALSFEEELQKIKPDVVHSFVLHISCLPILKVMKRYNAIKWIYSSWGSDLFNKKNKPNFEANLREVLSSVGYLFTDCYRDYEIAKKYQFQGVFLGVFPGGGGYDFSLYDRSLIAPIIQRNTILVKGYENSIGRGLNILKAINRLKNELKEYKIVVLGAEKGILDFVVKEKMEENINLNVFHKEKINLAHSEVMRLMGQSLVYIGNSNSDGIPNTLLEAIVMGAFPIQSNPGDVTQEVITHKKNGLLIQDCENVDEIETNLLIALDDIELIKTAFNFNQNEVKPQYEIGKIRESVIKAYKKVMYDNKPT